MLTSGCGMPKMPRALFVTVMLFIVCRTISWNPSVTMASIVPSQSKRWDPEGQRRQQRHERQTGSTAHVGQTTKWNCPAAPVRHQSGRIGANMRNATYPRSSSPARPTTTFNPRASRIHAPWEEDARALLALQVGDESFSIRIGITRRERSHYEILKKPKLQPQAPCGPRPEIAPSGRMRASRGWLRQAPLEAYGHGHRQLLLPRIRVGLRLGPAAGS